MLLKIEYKISQYVDNTEIMLEGGNSTFGETVKTVNTFKNQSELFLNVGQPSCLYCLVIKDVILLDM